MIFRLIFAAFLVTWACGFGFGFNAFRSVNSLCKYNFKQKIQAFMSTESTTETSSPKKFTSKTSREKDLSSYNVGQKLSGPVVNVKAFGVFVKLSQGVDALLPRSTLSSTQYNRLKGMLDKNSTESVEIEILAVDNVKQTLSAKYIPAGGQNNIDIYSIDPKELKTKTFDAEVISTHTFGVFAQILGSDCDGLIPASMLTDKSNIAKDYPVGTQLQVKVHEVNRETKKLTLTMKSASSQDVSVVSNIPHNKWIEGVVQKVLEFGLIVRPVGFDVTGMVHKSQIPRGLTNALRNRVTVTPGQNKSDVELFFHEGDVIKMRVQSISKENNKIELSMQPFSQSEDDDDDYIVEGRETDEEAEEAEREAKEKEDDAVSNYDPESLLLWWNGQAYHKIDDHTAAAVDEELAIVNESEDIVEGTWRRLFEIDMREDEADFTSKATEMDQKEQDEEIGELSGLDNDMVDSIGFGSEYKRNKAGSFVSLNSLPEEWKNQLNFIKELETEESQKLKSLKAGKAGEAIELNTLVQKMEQDAIDAMASRQSRSNARAEVPADSALE